MAATVFATATNVAPGFRALPLPIAQLSLSAVLKCGQSFRWSIFPLALQDAGLAGGMPSHEYRFCLRDRVVRLRQSVDMLYYRSEYPPIAHTVAEVESKEAETLAWIRDYFQLDIDLLQLHDQWSTRDPIILRLRDDFSGIRILRQDPFECLISFICSSNNNISRITNMVKALCKEFSPPLLKLGPPDGTEDVLEAYHPFPVPSALAAPEVAKTLRLLGFGYRAEFIQKTAQMLVEAHGIPQNTKISLEPAEVWLRTLRQMPTMEAREELLKFVGVGRKVADCVLLMSMDKVADVVPVDTHVHQIAVKHYGMSGSTSKSKTNMTPKLYEQVTSKLTTMWGSYAGWAHSVLFTSDLKAFSANSIESTPRPTQSPGKRKRKSSSADQPPPLAVIPAIDEVTNTVATTADDGNLVDRVKRQFAYTAMDVLRDLHPGNVATADEPDGADQQVRLSSTTEQISTGTIASDESPSEPDGWIEPTKPLSEVRQEPYPLPADLELEWSSIDITDDEQLEQLQVFLSENYIEDEDDGSFRMYYSSGFLRWALCPPGYHREWHIPVRAKDTKQIMAFVSAIPVVVRIRENVVNSREVNFLCVHKSMRGKRLTPSLVKEAERRGHLKGLNCALYTAGTLLPNALSACRYFHRPLNFPKLVDVQYYAVPEDTTIESLIEKFTLPPKELPLIPGLREMEERDVAQVAALYNTYMTRFDLVLEFTPEEIRHHLLGGTEKRRDTQERFVWTYVVEDLNSGALTDFVSFFSTPYSILFPNGEQHTTLELAYLYFYGTTVPEGGTDSDTDTAHTHRLALLVENMLYVAKVRGFDVFNALDVMDNAKFMRHLKFGRGTGILKYYIDNWRTAPLDSGMGIGVVML
ncbi:hypothetical protein NM688_g3089 [Phlebia brevispora]|uniref:Uncharacterized protein n=1 Tax=Phlebia brevispora TaxID=194682 RepID=A0ACC1T6N7_9APHY|nr:hypothetical protein NM688_g3089 [Phlebia brevispora]